MVLSVLIVTGVYIFMIKKIYCPRCGKWLFSVGKKTSGTIYIWCRGCREEIKITLEPLSH